MSDTIEATDRARTDAIGRRYMIRFEEDTLKQRPLWTRCIIEFLGTALLVTVAAGAGVINRYAGGNPISRTAAVVAPGALVMALIYAWGPLSGLHINPAVTVAFTGRRVFKASWALPYIVAQFAGADSRRVVLAAHVQPRRRRRQLPHRQAWRRLEIVRDGDRPDDDSRQCHPQHRDRIPQHRPQRRHRGRRNDRAARPVRQPDQRRVDEPGTHARTRHRRRRFHRLVGVRLRAPHRGDDRRDARSAWFGASPTRKSEKLPKEEPCRSTITPCPRSSNPTD